MDHAAILDASRSFLTEHDKDPQVFEVLLKAFLSENAYIDWNKWKFLPNEMQKDIDQLPEPTQDELPSLFSRVAVVRLNGGLGTTMGCEGPKSTIVVRDGLSFLDIALEQHKENPNVPLLFMNSFNTQSETSAIVGDRAFCFEQSTCPRLDADTLLPIQPPQCWYPPGHGNIFVSLEESGVLDRLLDKGRDIIFVSNIDNTGATLDTRILKFMVESSAEYVMECTPKTEADLKGGTLIEIDGTPMHLEIPQVPPEHLDDFCSTRVFKIFNTNNIWVNLGAVKGRSRQMTSEIIVNRKTLPTGEKVIQLETSIGGMIRNFKKVYCVNVPRSRFIPVKTTADLLAVCSDLYSFENFRLRLRVPLPPKITLSKHFSTVSSLCSRFPVWPSLLEVSSLSLDGDLFFLGPVTFKGNVIVQGKNRTEIAAGRVYDGTK